MCHTFDCANSCWKNHDAWCDWGSTEHQVHLLSLKLHLVFCVPETCWKSNGHRGKWGQFDRRTFDCGQGSKWRCWNLFLCCCFTISVCFCGSLLLQPPNHPPILMKLCLTVSSPTWIYQQLWPNVGELMQENKILMVNLSCECRPVVLSMQSLQAVSSATSNWWLIPKKFLGG